MIKTGEFVSDYVEPAGNRELDEKQIQPNGVDLSIECIGSFQGKSYIADDGRIPAKREEVSRINPTEVSVGNDDTLDMGESYNLTRGVYVVRYGERITIPEDFVGFVLPRSRLMRNGIHLSTTVWDQGYSGIGEGGLFVMNPVQLEADMRIGQMVMCRAEKAGELYDRNYQHENIDE